MPETTSYKFIPTAHSMRRAHDIADRLGMPFDPSETENRAIWLNERYFNDICSVIPEETEAVSFSSLAFRSFEAGIAPMRDGGTHIEIDQQWGFALLDANLLVSIRACALPDPKQSALTALLFKRTLLTLADPQDHEQLREAMWPLFEQYPQVLLLANLLTQTMFAFMICHEIAHQACGHLDKDESPMMELEADRLAFQYLQSVSEQFEQLPNLKIPPNFVGAPILFMRYLSGLQKLGLIPEQSDTHPSPKERERQLRDVFNEVANPEATYLLDGLIKGCDELMDEV